ncbi:Rpn family recombination-promoting nuclease/putative transposase [Candidatus Magnetobacterium casense]|uniref:Rpn family recombination-promoting nuclease/putative transposase n=1 Tax=Candidatus Magnetobacterium casense TaxID=1455061 RepID=UPI000697DA58|nr:Rpn family recombination-promoting nuclease/putative transposase [Candidatus Magnetobacterium casensis]
MRFVDVKSDIAFKRIFGNETKKEILISFLNAVLGLTGDREIGEITLLSPYQAPKIDELKYTILDIRAVDKRGVTFIIEIQVQREKGFAKRVLYYTSKAYINQLGRGDDYPALNQVIYIGIVDFNIFEGDNYLTRHLILNAATFKQELEDFEFYFIELPKFKKKEDEVESIIEKWVYFIKNASSLEMVPKCADFVEIKDAYEIANKSTWNKEDFEVYEYWQIRRQIDKSAIEYAVESAVKSAEEKALIAEEKALIKGQLEGERKGIIKGKIEGLIEGERKGLIKGIEMVLDIKYGDKGTALMDNVRRLENIEQLDEFKGLLKKSTSLDELWGYLRHKM